MLGLLSLLSVGCRRGEAVDPLLRSKIDGLNRQAFLDRYRAPVHCLVLADSALAFISDSLPEYTDGILRALNIKAFAYYQKSNYAEAEKMLGQLDNTLKRKSSVGGGSGTAEVEWVISELLRARMEQRRGQIADSYRRLYDIGHSRVLERNRNSLLYNYAQTEYYITMLVLNYHYRDNRQTDVRTLIDEVERNRDRLQVDYAQDMALNYALAYGWQSAGESDIAIDYCYDNFRLLDISPSSFCPYHYANTLQMLASALKSVPEMTPPDSLLALYDTARRLFFEYGDPYQMLGGTVSTARYALLIGDTAKAHQVLAEWRGTGKQAQSQRSGKWQPFSAPKMELSYFDVLLRSRMAATPDEALQWYERYSKLSDRIKENEKKDFVLQQTLANATRRSRWTTRTAMIVSVLSLILLVLTIQLWISARRLKREKLQLEAANRRDVERIANVETALSVMRHDISPFMGYLANPQLPAEVRGEVTGQLLRTFDNLKRWTNLSLPAGMSFTASVFPLQEVMDEVDGECGMENNRLAGGDSGQPSIPHAALTFVPTDLRMWGDRSLVVILLRNLVNNALKHTAEGSVTVSAEAEGDEWVHLRVADTGSGMTEEQQQELFRADRTLPPGADHGFGLLLCRYIVRRHDDQTRRGCRIWVESTLGQGTTMHVLLSAPKVKTHTRLNNP